MKSLLFAVCAVLALVVAAAEVAAQTIVLNPPGPFNRTVIRGGGPGAAVAATVNRPGFSASAAIGNPGRQGNAAAVASFNGFNVSASAGRNFNSARFNSFGTRTVQDANGNVFEQDANGNVRFLGNRFNNGFNRFSGFNQFNSHPQSFGGVSGFSVNSFGVRNFGGGFCH